MKAANRLDDSTAWERRIGCQLLAMGALILLSFASVRTARSAPLTQITIDGDFSDWASVPNYSDPDSAPGVLHNGIPDTHHTDANFLGDVPSYRDHPDVDILEYKFTHDEQNLYAYFKADGVIGRTQQSSEGNAGRYYVIVTIDVDSDDATGYFLHQGGYYPTSGVERYDMNMEAEFYDGTLNTAHYLSHDALGSAQLNLDFKSLTSGAYTSANPGPYTPGYVQPAPGNYRDYTQWVYHDDDTLTLVKDRGPVVPGIMSVRLSSDGHEIEIGAPFRGFLNNAGGYPNMALGKTIDISFSLEASGELAPDNDWASDTADPINAYFLDSYRGDLTFDGRVDGEDLTDPAEGWEARFGADLDGSAFLEWQQSFGAGVASISAIRGVPEPSTFLLLFGMACLRTRVRRRSAPFDIS